MDWGFILFRGYFKENDIFWTLSTFPWDLDEFHQFLPAFPLFSPFISFFTWPFHIPHYNSFIPAKSYPQSYKAQGTPTPAKLIALLLKIQVTQGMKLWWGWWSWWCVMYEFYPHTPKYRRNPIFIHIIIVLLLQKMKRLSLFVCFSSFICHFSPKMKPADQYHHDYFYQKYSQIKHIPIIIITIMSCCRIYFFVKYDDDVTTRAHPSIYR